MTNYEWLVKNGELTDFLIYFQYELDSDVENRYNIPWLNNKSVIESVAIWLQAERKEPQKKKYVAFDDVLEILRMPRKLELVNTNRKIDMPAIMKMESKHYFDMQAALFSLETKEIDE